MSDILMPPTEAECLAMAAQHKTSAEAAEALGRDYAWQYRHWEAWWTTRAEHARERDHPNEEVLF